MAQIRRAVLIALPPFVGSAIMLLATQDLGQATSTISKNLAYFGIRTQPEWLLARATDGWAFGTGLGIVAAWLGWLWWEHREPKSGREKFQAVLADWISQHERSLDLLVGLKTDDELISVRPKVQEFLTSAGDWIAAHLGPVAMTKYSRTGARRIYLWDGDHNQEIRIERLEMMNTLVYRIENLKSIYEFSDWDGDPPLRRRPSPPGIGKWEGELWQ